MAKISLIFTIFLSMAYLVTGNAQEKSIENDAQKEYISIGENFQVNAILSAGSMEEKYDDLKHGDTVNVTFKSYVTAVCKNKGCWMKMALEDGREVMVKFKDYTFFVPRDIEKRVAIINGKAYVEEMSVEDQRHYAEDTGMSAEEISEIVNPKKTFSFIAEGVRIKKEL